MIQGLIILNSSHPGSRDLYWVDDTDPRVVGYNVYRSEDASVNWIKINKYAVEGYRYRDQLQFENITYTFDLARDWVEQGEFGSYRLRVRGEAFWSSSVKGRATIAAHPDDLVLFVNGVQCRPARVIGAEGEIWLPRESLVPSSPTSGPAMMTKAAFNPSDIQEIKIIYQKLQNQVNLYLGTQTFYTVVPVDAGGNEMHTPGAPGTEIRGIMDVDSMDYMQREMVRRNAWLFEQVGEPAWLLIRKTKGESCGCVNPETREAKTACKICHETGFVGGYYGPLDFLFIDPDSSATRTLEEGGVKVERESTSYLGPTPIIKAGDLIIRHNGERLVIADPTYKSPRGVLLQQEFKVELLPPGSTRYLIPIYPDGDGGVFNPAFGTQALPDEPVSDPLTDPTKVWENKDQRPIGRTTTFGRINS